MVNGLMSYRGKVTVVKGVNYKAGRKGKCGIKMGYVWR